MLAEEVNLAVVVEILLGDLFFIVPIMLFIFLNGDTFPVSLFVCFFFPLFFIVLHCSECLQRRIWWSWVELTGRESRGFGRRGGWRFRERGRSMIKHLLFFSFACIMPFTFLNG